LEVVLLGGVLLLDGRTLNVLEKKQTHPYLKERVLLLS
jgi:hypothetical protein